MTVLDVMKKEMLIEASQAVGKTLLKGLYNLYSKYAFIGQIRGSGLCLGIELVHDRLSRKPCSQLARLVIER